MNGALIVTRDEWRVLDELTRPCGDLATDDVARILHGLLDRDLVNVAHLDGLDAFEISARGRRALRYGIVQDEMMAREVGIE